MRTTIAELPRLYDESEVAAYLDCSIDTVRRLRRAGELKSIKIGRKVRIRHDQLLEYIGGKQCEIKSTKDKSETTGYRSDQAQPTGTEHGSTPKHDRHAAHLSAQSLFGKPK